MITDTNLDSNVNESVGLLRDGRRSFANDLDKIVLEDRLHSMGSRKRRAPQGLAKSASATLSCRAVD